LAVGLASSGVAPAPTLCPMPVPGPGNIMFVAAIRDLQSTLLGDARHWLRASRVEDLNMRKLQALRALTITHVSYGHGVLVPRLASDIHMLAPRLYGTLAYDPTCTLLGGSGQVSSRLGAS
jgi:hypothetical protein